MDTLESIGIVVGIVITAIFGFLPTLAAGQIRPANVLRPSDTVIPQAGRLSAFATTVVLIMALSLVAQGLLAGLLGDAEISGVRVTTLTTALGAVYGVLIAVPLVLGDIQSMRRRRRGRSWPLHALLWLALLIGLPVAGAAFGAAVPAIIVLTVIVLLVAEQGAANALDHAEQFRVERDEGQEARDPVQRQPGHAERAGEKLGPRPHARRHHQRRCQPDLQA